MVVEELVGHGVDGLPHRGLILAGVADVGQVEPHRPTWVGSQLAVEKGDGLHRGVHLVGGALDEERGRLVVARRVGSEQVGLVQR